MSNNADLTNDNPIRKNWLPIELAVERVLDFEERFGEDSLLLACHAALPSILTPELVNLIRINFLCETNLDWFADADFLLSSLCSELEEGLYQIEPSVRQVLLVELENKFGKQRFTELADFLLTYLEKKPSKRLPKELTQLQQWIGESYFDADDVAKQLSEILDQSNESNQNLANQIQVINAFEILSDSFPINDSYKALEQKSRNFASYIYGTKKLTEASPENTLTAFAKEFTNKQENPNRINYLPERNRFFTGHADILNQLADLFTSNKRVAMNQAISGLAGIGKTQTALEFCYRHINDYQTILWVTAENEIRFNDSYFSIANLLNLIGNNSGALKTEDIIGLVKNWLVNNSNWLMVLDDLEDPKLIKEYLPPNHQGHVLITTRSQLLSQIAIIRLNKMSLEESALFLLKRANLVPIETQSLNQVDIVNESLANAKKIAELVDGLPLALRQAAAFIYETKCSLSDYLSFYQQALIDKQAKDLGEHASVFATFKLAFDKVKETNLTAYKLLKICSFLDNEFIPEEIFTQTGKFLGDELSKLQSNNYEFNNCLKILLNYSLINRDINNQFISIHRLVRSVIYNLVDDSEKKILVESLINALDYLCSDKLEATNNWPQYKRLLTSIINLVSFINTLELKTLKAAYLFNRVSSYCRTQALFAQYLQFNQEALKIYQHHFGNNNEFVANTLNNIGNFYYEQGQYGTALSYLDNALNIQQEIKNADSSIIATLTNMGNVYKAQGRYSGALSYYNQALNIKKAFPSNNSLDTAFILHNIGEVYHQQGKYTEALDYYNQALDIRKQLFNNDHPDVANSLNNIAIIYIDQSKYTEALDYFQQALSIYKKHFDNIHPYIADVLNNIGEVYRNEGKYAEALAHYKESLSIKKQLFGDNHPSVAVTLNNIAIIHDFQSNYIEALNDFQQALDIRKQTFGDDHPSVAATLNNISIIYDSQGKYAEALEYSQKALAIYQQYLGDNHPDVAQTFNNIAATYLNQHKYSEALKNFQQALSIFQNSFGDNHPLVASIINNIGEVYRNEGKYTEALEQYNQALSIRQQTLGANHPDIATNLNNIGLIYNAQGKYNEALSEFQQAINIRKEAFGNNHPAVASVIHNIGAVCRNQSKYTEALDHFQQALLLRKEAFGLSHPDISTSFNSIGATYAMQGDYEKALEYFFQALSVKKEVSGEIDIGVADIFNNISGVFFEQSKYKEALDYSFQALSIEKQLFGESHLELTNTLNNIANIYQIQNNYKEALNYYYQALSIKKQFLGDLHPDVATILINIGIVYSKQDKHEQALEFCNQALSIKRQTLGDFHIDVASVLNNIGEIYRSQSKYTEALGFYLQSLSIKEKVLGTSHPSIAHTLNNIAGVYANQADYQQALDFYNQALSIYKQNFGNSHSSIAQTLNNIASVYDGQAKFREALDFYNQALSIRKEIFGDSNPDVAQTLNDMGSVYLEQGNFQEALNLYNQALSIYKQFFGDSNLQVASTLNNIGNVYQNQEQYLEALEVYNQSLSIRKQIFGEYDLHVGQSLNNISGVLIRLGKYEEALNYLQQTLTLYQQIFTKPHPNVAQTLSNIATVYLNQGNYKNAETHFLEALSIYEKVFGRNHLDTAKILHNLGLLYQTTNRNSQAATHFREALTIYNQFLPNNHPLIIQLLSSYNPVGTKINSSPSINRKLLFNQLAALVPGEFNLLLFVINPPLGLIPPIGTTRQADRLITLLQWAESPSGCGLNKVQEVLETILNPLADISMQTRSAVEQTINANQSIPYIRPNKDKIDFEKIAIGTIKSEPIYYTKKDISKEFWGNDQSSRRFTNLIYEAISESGYGLFEVEKAVNVVQQAFPDFWKNQTISNNLPNYNESIFPAKIIVEADLKITNQNDEKIILYPKTIKQKPILFDIPENREKPAYCNINIELEEKTLTINKGTSQLAHLVITLEIDVTSLIANFLNHVNAYVFLRSGQQFLEFVTHQLKEQSLKVSFETNFGENIIAEFTLMIGKGLDKIKSPEIDIEEIIWAYEHINQVINPLDKIRIYQHSTKVNLNNSANIESRKQLEKELKEWQQEELIWLIKQGKDVWNNWRVRNKTIIIDLSEQDLTNRLLPFTLTYFNLDNVNLEKSNLSNLHLGDAKLRNANLKQTKFNKAIIDLANFTGSNLDNSEIQDCRVVRADFTNVSLKQANLRNTQFSNTTFNNVIFQETILESTQFSSCTIENCDFTNVVTPSNLTITEFLEILSKQNKIIGQKYLNKQIIPQNKQNDQTYLNSTTPVNPIPSDINKTTNAINNASVNAKYSNQLIQLLKQKFDSLINKPPRQFLLGLEDFLSFINRDNSPIHIITTKLQNELLHQHSFIKNQFEIEKNKAIEIKNKLIEQYPEMDDSHKDDIDFDDDYGSPEYPDFSFKEFNNIIKNPLKVPIYELNHNSKDDKTKIDELLHILEIKMNEHGISKNSQTNLLAEEFDKTIWFEFADLEKQHDYNHQEWSNYCQTSPSVALLRLQKIISKINPEPEDETNFRKLPFKEKIESVFQQLPEYIGYSWISDLIKGKVSENDKKILSKIENLKQDIKCLYEKLHEEMILSNHKEESTMNVIELEEMILTKLHDVAQEKGYNRLVDLDDISNELGERDLIKVSDIAASLSRKGLIMWIDSDSGAGGARITSEGSRVVLMGGKTGIIGKYRQNPSVVYNIDQSIKVGSISNSAFAAHSNSTAQQININPEIDKLFSELSKLIQNDPSSSNSDKKDAIEILSEVKNSLLSKALSFAKAKITLAGLKDMFPNTTQKIDQLIETIKEIY